MTNEKNILLNNLKNNLIKNNFNKYNNFKNNYINNIIDNIHIKYYNDDDEAYAEAEYQFDEYLLKLNNIYLLYKNEFESIYDVEI